MMTRRGLVVAVALLAVVGASVPAFAEASPGTEPVATIENFSDLLLNVMKEGQQLGFAGRRDKLANTIRQTFDIPLMTRLIVGPQWSGLTPAQQQQLVSAFGDFSIATYANRFDDYSGEQFQFRDDTSALPNGDQIVKTQLVTTGSSGTVEIDYLMHNDNGRWQAIDVYLSGTVSELATRRSEFTSVLRRSGADALVELLKQKTAELSG